MEDKEINYKLKDCKTAEELKTVAKEIGYELTDEEANAYFKQFAASGELGDDELSNVTGGCAKWRNGRAYSGNPPHQLIVTCGNTCPLYDLNPGYPEWKINMFKGKCAVCLNMNQIGVTMYCNKRKYYDDPYNR